MISYKEALHIVLNNPVHLKTETVALTESLHRVLASDVSSDINMPPFNKAAMDGFAIREADIEKELTIIETVAAGQIPTKKVESGQATKIMTGAPVPEGADFVIQVELSEMLSERTVKFNGHPKNNIIPEAEDVTKGDIVLQKGQKINASHLAVLASVGCSAPEVYKQPLIGIISTGSEIVEPTQKPEASQIRNSNGYQLIAQVTDCNAIPKYYGIIEDNYTATFNGLKKAIEECDMVLLTGGVSMGEFDFVPKIMEELGIDIKFESVAVQPGKPTTFGTLNSKFIFGLPGNPVSAFVQFEILVKPLIKKLTGDTSKDNIIKLPLGNDFKRKKGNRLAFLPVSISPSSEVFTSEYHGSAHIYALPNADALAEIPEGIVELKKGDLVNVRLL